MFFLLLENSISYTVYTADILLALWMKFRDEVFEQQKLTIASGN